jgi:hypothetical protein
LRSVNDHDEANDLNDPHHLQVSCSVWRNGGVLAVRVISLPLDPLNTSIFSSRHLFSAGADNMIVPRLKIRCIRSVCPSFRQSVCAKRSSRSEVCSVHVTVLMSRRIPVYSTVARKHCHSSCASNAQPYALTLFSFDSRILTASLTRAPGAHSPHLTLTGDPSTQASDGVWKD